MLDKQEISRNFSASAKDYEKHAVLQKELADQLLSHLADGSINSPSQPSRALSRDLPANKLLTILDLGCGTGYLIVKLKELFPEAKIIGLDIAPGMIEVANQKHKNCQLGDGESLPFDNGTFDLVVSNASLQWMDAGKVFSEVQRVLSPEGNFYFLTFGLETLKELKESGFRVNEFISLQELAALAKDKFEVINLEAKMVVKKFKTIKELCLHLKATGAQTTERTKTDLSAFRKYREKYGQDGFIPATYEITFGHFMVL